MQAYQRGDADAFETLYRRHKDPLYNFLYRNLQQRAIVEELAHDAWTAVIQRSQNYQPSARFKTWLYRIAHNRLVDHWRRQQPLSVEGSLDEAPGPDGEQPEQQLQNQQRQRDILKAIASLPTEQRQVLLLREEGFSHQQICQISGAGQEAVKSRLRYAKQQLRTLLEEDR